MTEEFRPPEASPAAGEDFSGPVGYSFLTGVFVAVNAVPDAYLLVEGPDCVHMKTQFVQGNHDWLSGLTDVSGFHRVANTALHPAHMAGSREERITRLLRRLASHPPAQVVLVTAMPMAAVTGVDYERLADEVRETVPTPILPVPGRSLSGDWLDGYSETLQVLARRLPLRGTPRSGAVALVGHLFDRHEEDCQGNVRELTRLLGGLDLELVSLWLDGGPVEGLARAGEAGLVVSLPYGRRAAKALAARTGAALLEAELPFGLEATERFLRQVARATGREARVDALVDAALARVVPKLEWVIPFLCQNRRVGYIGDPHVLPGFVDLCALLGLHLELAVVPNRAAHARGVKERLPPETLLVAPTRRVLAERVGGLLEARRMDLLVGNGLAMDFPGVEVMSFGFPSELAHALYDRPYLGFAGALAFCDTLANHLRRVDRAQWGGFYSPRGPLLRPPG